MYIFNFCKFIALIDSQLDYIFTLMTVFLSLMSILSTLLIYGGIRNKIKYPIVVDFVAYLTTIDICLWNLLPAFLRIFSGGKWEAEQNISSVEILYVYTLEFISLLFFYLSISVVFRIRNLNFCYLRLSLLKRIIRSNNIQILNTYSKYSSRFRRCYDLFFILIITSGLYLAINRIFGISATIIPVLDLSLIHI